MLKTESPVPRLIFPLGLLAVYVIVGVIGLVHHEMWRDEVFPWLLAKASGSLRELFANLWYDAAHFPAWHLILWVLTRFTHNIVAMQIVHLFVASAAVGLFVFYSPFSKTQKLLFCFGYFPVFEYCVICRMYGLVWPLLFLFCAIFSTRHRTYLPLAAVLFAMANTTPVGAIMAVALASGLAAEFAISKELRAGRRADPIAGAILFVIAIGLGAVQLWHKAQDLPAAVFAGLVDEQSPFWRLASVLADVWCAYVPFAVRPLHFGSYALSPDMFLDSVGRVDGVPAILSVAILVLSCVSLYRDRVALIVYVTGTTLFLAFAAAVGKGIRLRHAGILFILYLGCLWLAKERPFRGWRSWFVSGILIIHVIAGLYAWSADYLSPFSASKQTAAFIREHNMRDLLLTGYSGNQVMPVAAYLDKGIYDPDSGRFESFHIPWQTNDFSVEHILRDAAALVTASNTDAVLVLNYRPRIRNGDTDEPLTSITLGSRVSITLAGYFDASYACDESYSVYLVRRQ